MIGPAYGGILGTLVGWGVSQEHNFKHKDYVRAIKDLVIVHGNIEDVAHARSILQDTRATALPIQAEASA